MTLFIDTSTSRLIIGIYKDNKELFIENKKANNDLSSMLLPDIKEALNSLNLSINDIDKIYVVNGPGSFTGIRVGVTVAKTLAWSKNIEIYPVSSLQLLASSSKKRYIVPMIDARRGYVYAGMYNRNLKSIIEDKYIKLDDLKKLLKKDYEMKDIEFVSYDKLENVIEPDLNIEKLLLKGKFKNVDAHKLNPNYLKKTEAEEKLNDKKNTR